MQRYMSVPEDEMPAEMPADLMVDHATFACSAIQRTDTPEAYGYWPEDFHFIGMDFPNQHELMAFISKHFGGLENLPKSLVQSFGNIKKVVSDKVELPRGNSVSCASPRLPTVNPADPVSVGRENQSLLNFLCNKHKTGSLVWNYQKMVDVKGWKMLDLMIFLSTL